MHPKGHVMHFQEMVIAYYILWLTVWENAAEEFLIF